jgi:hypothetical protein
VVFMAVGEEYAANLVAFFPEAGNIRNYQIDTEHMGFRKHESAVDNDDIIAMLEEHHIEADFAQPTEGYDPETFVFVYFACHVMVFINRGKRGRLRNLPISPFRNGYRRPDSLSSHRNGKSIPCRGWKIPARHKMNCAGNGMQ